MWKKERTIRKSENSRFKLRTHTDSSNQKREKEIENNVNGI